MDQLLAKLNDRQREAVTLPACHALILAGAGSGKTRVLVHRLAYLFNHYQISPHRVLAVTFTNKAAGEMRARIESLFQINTQGMWVGTFHGLAHRLLRLHWQDVGLPQNFQVLDSDDQYRLVRRVLKNLGLDEKFWAPKTAQDFINKQKDAGHRPHQVAYQQDLHKATLVKIYQAYEDLCQQNGVVDFAELLLRAYELWLKRPDILKHYQERFSHILVDEFQDTNPIQYNWLKLLAGKQSYMMAVGDDDQSIYGWRGAKIENIHRFQSDFADVVTIRLEQNYRSTQNILSAANSVIAHNQERLGKNLWTDGKVGEPIQLYTAFNELDEARFIVSKIQQAAAQGIARQDMAILYRSNAQSRVLEEALLQAAIPYRVYGGLRFFERAEIKDALAYLRLISNHHDDGAFERIINTPTRGIGERTVENIREVARSQSISLWQAATRMVSTMALSGKAKNAVEQFLTNLGVMAADIAELPLYEQVEQVISASGLIPHYEKEPGEKGQARLENLAELVTGARQFAPDETDAPLSPLAAFLSHAVLESGEGQAETHQDSVQLMTLHSSKGLEFKVVFLSGMEEELFPPRYAMEDPKRLEEERRLCYVGMTRAMVQLFITHAEYRRLYGENRPHRPSRFIREIPAEHIAEVRMKTQISRPLSYEENYKRSAPPVRGAQYETGLPFKIGQHVRHAKFGEGVILNYEGSGEQVRLQVKFSRDGVKWLVAAYANLEAA